MAQTIKLKRGTTTPTTSDIVSGEVAIDTSAQKFYVNDAGTIKEIGGGGGSELSVLYTKTLDDPNAYGTPDGDRFGFSVAVSGNYAIVGAYAEDDAGGGGSGDQSGKAYIFDVTTGSLLHTLDNPNAYSTSTSDSFGGSVGISGNYAIVSADGESDAGGTSSGKAYIFDVTTGSLLHTLDNPNAYSTSASDRFGTAVAISGNYAIVSTRFEDDAGGISSGKAYIFNVTTGTLVYTLNNPNAYSTSASDNFGISVAISGNYAIVGAYYEDEAGGDKAGKAYIYDISTFTTSTISSANYVLDDPNAYSTSLNDNFGYSVAISGNYAIVGAYPEDDAGGFSSGKAYIYDISTFTSSTISSANYVLDNPNAYGTSASDFFGRSVSISGNYAIVGATGEDDAGGTQSGKAYIYDISTFSSSTISSANYVLDNPNAAYTSANDAFGTSVSISGNYALVGTLEYTDNTNLFMGSAHIFKTNGLPYTYSPQEITSFAPSGHLSNVVEDTTPQLGGHLDGNGYGINLSGLGGSKGITLGSNSAQIYNDSSQTLWIEGLGGKVYIQSYAGNESISLNYNSEIKFEFSNVVKFLMNGSAGDFHADGDVIAYSTTISDQRLKDDVETIDSALDKVSNLRGVTYTWNAGSRQGQRDLGVIAQEVEAVIPEIVYEKEMALIDGETYKTVDYEKLTAVLIEAVKELKAEVEALKGAK